MKALCLVAHPDDCVIFGYSFIYNHQHYEWTVGYLTHLEYDDRAKEVTNFWQRRGIQTVFLGFEDHWLDNEQQTFTRWNPADAIKACQTLVADYGVVLTHGANGEYGHIHHKLVHNAVKDHLNVIEFCDLGEGPTYSVPNGQYSLEELPLHAEIVHNFHRFQHRNSYKVSR